jgi:hypothetical protein
VPWHGAAIEAHVAAGRLGPATELLASLEATCQPLPCQAPRAVAAWGGATLAWKQGDTDDAGAGFERALAHNARVPMPLAEAETLIVYGRFLRQTRDGSGRELTVAWPDRVACAGSVGAEPATVSAWADGAA